MKLVVQRESLLEFLQEFIGILEKRQTRPILSNVLLSLDNGILKLIASDSEIELVGTIQVNMEAPGETTLPGRRFYDICKGLPEGATIKIQVDEQQKALIQSGRSRFVLSTLSAAEFPLMQAAIAGESIALPQKNLLELFSYTAFSMAQQDVRHFLNGLFLEVKGRQLRAVATDGHRLATAYMELSEPAKDQQLIVPRKAVLELLKICRQVPDKVTMTFAERHIRVALQSFTLTSKLVDGRYPDYTRVIPQKGQNTLWVDRDQFRQALQLAAVLSSEKYRTVKFRFEAESQTLMLSANNPEQEQAENELAVKYEGKSFETAFNVSYLLDVLLAIPNGTIEMSLAGPGSSALIHPEGHQKELYVVMPIVL